MGKAVSIISEGLSTLLFYFKQPTHPAVLAPAFILQMGVLTLVKFQTKAGPWSHHRFGSSAFRPIGWQCLSLGADLLLSSQAGSQCLCGNFRVSAVTCIGNQLLLLTLARTLLTPLGRSQIVCVLLQHFSKRTKNCLKKNPDLGRHKALQLCSISNYSNCNLIFC